MNDCPLHFLGMVLDGRKKVATKNNHLSLGAQSWRDHLSCSPKVCRTKCQEMWSLVSEWETLTEYFSDYDDHQIPERS